MIKSWDCPKKQTARFETIINLYRKKFYNELPIEKQYWSMSGLCANLNGTLQEGSELHQLLESKLILPNQFHGVEICKETHDLNKQVPIGNWYNNDFYSEMVSYKNFNPGIVNADILHFPKKASPYFVKIMSILTNISNVMLVGNFVLRYRQNAIEKLDDIVLELSNQPQFKTISKKWNLYPDLYVYNGTGRTSTIMGTVVFYKKGDLCF